MKIFELINELSVFQGGQEVFHAGDGVLTVAGIPQITVPSGVLYNAGTKFSSKASAKAATDAGLIPSNFEGQASSGREGYTAADVQAIVAALQADLSAAAGLEDAE